MSAVVETFTLLELPSEGPLMQILGLLPHNALGNVAATCPYLHATVHSSPSLWRRLFLRPATMDTTAAATQSLIAMLRQHGNDVVSVELKDTETEVWHDRRRAQVNLFITSVST